jgi:hypothetical protein
MQMDTNDEQNGTDRCCHQCNANFFGECVDDALLNQKKGVKVL